MLLKVAEDFRKYTLQAFPTLVEKLAYISSLQNQQGGYTHWGLSRIFGDHRAQKAIRTVHSELALEVLRRPISALYQELQQPERLNSEFLRLKAPSSHDELLSAHLQLVQESLVAVAAQTTASQPAA